MALFFLMVSGGVSDVVVIIVVFVVFHGLAANDVEHAFVQRATTSVPR